ncbi:hypothetical protein C8R43DRAFT_1109599 [Mycena crocata]|nr:hypothetical protein C8R43DRAFT_1109599 [Mycena crocata]
MDSFTTVPTKSEEIVLPPTNEDGGGGSSGSCVVCKEDTTLPPTNEDGGGGSSGSVEAFFVLSVEVWWEEGHAKATTRIWFWFCALLLLPTFFCDPRRWFYEAMN